MKHYERNSFQKNVRIIMPIKETFTRKFAKLFLEDDDSAHSWIDDPPLFSMWHLLVISLLVFFLLNVLTTSFFDYFRNSTDFALAYRVTKVVFSCYVLTIIFIFAFRYYQHTVINKRIIYLTNILFFYIAGFLCFFLLYNSLYYLSPDLFRVDNSIPSVLPTLRASGVDSYKTNVHFILFSAFQSVNGNYFRIFPNSIIVSILTYFQSLYTISLVALFISAYVNQQTKH